MQTCTDGRLRLCVNSISRSSSLLVRMTVCVRRIQPTGHWLTTQRQTSSLLSPPLTRWDYRKTRYIPCSSTPLHSRFDVSGRRSNSSLILWCLCCHCVMLSVCLSPLCACYYTAVSPTVAADHWIDRLRPEARAMDESVCRSTGIFGSAWRICVKRYARAD